MSVKLSNVILNGNGLRLFCNQCGRCKDLNIKTFSAKYGQEIILSSIGKRAKCSKCGFRGASVQVVAG